MTLLRCNASAESPSAPLLPWPSLPCAATAAVYASTTGSDAGTTSTTLKHTVSPPKPELLSHVLRMRS